MTSSSFFVAFNGKGNIYVMIESIFSVILMAGILIASWFITSQFARWMYRRCQRCGTLNAKRRLECRNCSYLFSDVSS